MGEFFLFADKALFTGVEFGVQGVNGGDIQGGGHADLGLELGETVNKVQAGGAVIKAAVYVGAGDGDKALGADDAGVVDEELHGALWGGASVAVEDGGFLWG